MKRDKLKKIPLKYTSDSKKYMDAFRKNIDLYIDEKVMTLKEISETADIPFSTLSNFLYGDSTDCKLSTAVKLARAFGVSIDELVGAETIDKETRECVSMSRNLQDHHRYVISSFVRHQCLLHGETPEKSKQISVLLPECRSGHLKTTAASEALNVDHLSPDIKTKVCLGLHIPCKHYEPHFMRDEILLLAADRDGANGETCVVSQGGNYYIVRKKIAFDNGIKQIKYISIIDNKSVLFTGGEIDDKIGYVIGFLNPDGSWGKR